MKNELVDKMVAELRKEAGPDVAAMAVITCKWIALLGMVKASRLDSYQKKVITDAFLSNIDDSIFVYSKTKGVDASAFKDIVVSLHLAMALNSPDLDPGSNVKH